MRRIPASERAPAAPPEVFRTVVICTGNVCRSRMAEQLLRARAEKFAPALAERLQIRSAGVEALHGASMDPYAALLSRHHGGDPAAHRAKQLTAPMVAGADLVLTAAAEHRAAAVRLVPRAASRTFMLTEFAALLDDVADRLPVLPQQWSGWPVSLRLSWIIAQAGRRRGLTPASEPRPEGIVDPYQRDDTVYRVCSRQIVHTVDRIHRASLRLSERIGERTGELLPLERPGPR